MTDVAIQGLRAMSAAAIASVESVAAHDLSRPQVGIATYHLLHGGQYHRTICIPAGVRLTGALIKIPTTLVICGHASVIVGDGEEVEIRGYLVIPASAGRKQAFLAYVDTYLTVSFATNAKTIEEAESEFTDEADMLFSRHGENHIVITGE